jgi:hypothetical protein
MKRNEAKEVELDISFERAVYRCVMLASPQQKFLLLIHFPPAARLRHARFRKVFTGRAKTTNVRSHWSWRKKEK